MPVLFTPIEAVIVKAINQDEFNDFSYQNPDWRCLEHGELPKTDLTEGRRALRNDLSANLKPSLPMSPQQSTNNETASSHMTIIKTDHIPIPYAEAKKSSPGSTTLFNSITTSSSSLASTSSSSNVQQKSAGNNHPSHRSLSANRVVTDQTDM